MRAKTTMWGEFQAERQKRGARTVDLETLYAQSAIVFAFSPQDVISELCVECMEFMLSAARSAASAISVLDSPDSNDDSHLATALKKYVEDTGEALKQVDNRLKKADSSLEGLFPDLLGHEAAAWRSLIGRRDVIAHQVLTVDDNRVRAEANRDFRTLLSLLENINFVPVMTDRTNRKIFGVQLRAEVLHRLPAVEPGSDVTAVIGGSLIFVCHDTEHGLLTYRLARSPEDKLLVASSRPGAFSVSMSPVRPEAG